MLERLYEWLTTFKLPTPRKDAYGFTQEITRDPSGLIRIQICDAHRESGGPLLPRSSHAIWKVLPPVGAGLNWLTIESVTAELYLDASDPDLMAVLLDEDNSDTDHAAIQHAIQSMTTEYQGAVLAFAYYDLGEKSPVIFCREDSLDEIEDDWGFDLETKPLRDKHLRPSFQDVINMLNAAPNFSGTIQNL